MDFLFVKYIFILLFMFVCFSVCFVCLFVYIVGFFIVGVLFFFCSSIKLLDPNVELIVHLEKQMVVLNLNLSYFGYLNKTESL